MQPRDPNSAPTGVIFCGGASQRMGQSKALLQHRGQSFLERQIGLIVDELGLAAVISTRSEVDAETAHLRSELARVYDDDSAGIPGPLGALLSIHRHMPDRNLLVVAVDMPLLERASVEPLLKRLRGDGLEGDGGPGGYCYELDGRIAPLCAIYRAAALAKFMAGADRLQKYSLQQLGDALGMERLVPGDSDRNGLRSFNTPEDLAAL